ncbi:MAG: uracil-DNA glycosylase [Candidatus Erginobacter occultus]|nr:uracil-DNA glycosylase [Candidatus Erginobacter occultus]
MRSLLYDFRRYFEQQKEEGIEYLESSSPGGLARPPRRPAARPVTAAAAKASRPAAPVPRPAAAPAPGPPLPPPAAGKAASDPREAYRTLLEELRVCRKCPLSGTRNHTVPGEGGNRQQVLFIGEGPGRDEDLSGRPFVGRSGKLLDKILAAVSLGREDIYITNIVKCRPPGNRDPEPAEVIACRPFLETQIKLLRPRLIVTLGLPAARTLLESTDSLGRLRGRFHDYQGIPLLPTYHPAYILRSYTVENRKKAWEDIKMVRDFLAGLRK